MGMEAPEITLRTWSSKKKTRTVNKLKLKNQFWIIRINLSYKIPFAPKRNNNKMLKEIITVW